ncbi:hypothetical protein WISP_01399 [Willisornis vidua]|uniref:Secreted protein n=1 Tax=Willisornis vidua TaxID=1566151 RepID=A0ABQ9DUI3_9PASS|nr:hypothetical protein WISP_01399 [Willisornis vidua]
MGGTVVLAVLVEVSGVAVGVDVDCVGGDVVLSVDEPMPVRARKDMKAKIREIPGGGRVVVYVGVGTDVLEVVAVGVDEPVADVVVLRVLLLVVLMGGTVVLAVLVEVSPGGAVVVDCIGGDVVLGVDEPVPIRKSRNRGNRQRHKMHQWDSICIEQKLSDRQLSHT